MRASEGDGSTIFGNFCKNCHGNPKVDSAPPPAVLKQIKDPGYYVRRTLPTPTDRRESNQVAEAILGEGKPIVDGWIEVCTVDSLGYEDVVRFDHEEKTYAIYRLKHGDLYATDGICTHGNTHLADGFVRGDQIECPKHNGRFNVIDGSPKRKPVCAALRTYAVKESHGKVLLNVKPSAADTAASEKHYQLRVVSNDNVATFIKELVLEPIDDASNVKYQPGDYLQFLIPAYGQISFNPNETKNRITQIFTTFVPGDSGKSDVVQGNFGDDVILGGLNSSADVLDGSVGNDIVLGDQGEVIFDLDADLDTLDRIRSYTDGLGGGDTISGNAGNDVLIGGTGGDTMFGDEAAASAGAADGEDIMLGDNADVLLTGPTGRLLVQVAAMPAPTAVDLITTTDTAEATGGADTMSGNAKADVMLGGVNNGGSDTLYGDRAAPTAMTIANDGDDIQLGDNGLLDFTFGTDTDRLTLDLIRSKEDALGGADTLSGNKGNDGSKPPGGRTE